MGANSRKVQQGGQRLTYVEMLRRDTGLESTVELRSRMQDKCRWRAMARGYDSDDDRVHLLQIFSNQDHFDLYISKLGLVTSTKCLLCLSWFYLASFANFKAHIPLVLSIWLFVMLLPHECLLSNVHGIGPSVCPQGAVGVDHRIHLGVILCLQM